MSTCAQTKTRSSTSVDVLSPKRPESAFESGDHVGRPLVQAERDLARVPEEERAHDPGDEREDEVGLAEVAALEPPRPLHLADPERGRDADEHERAEEVDEEREPALALEPRERRSVREARLAVDDVDQRDEDRREEDDEAPEDERVHEPGAEPLEELPLAEDDRRSRSRPASGGRRSAGAERPCGRGARAAARAVRTASAPRPRPPPGRARRARRLSRLSLS